MYIKARVDGSSYVLNFSTQNWYVTTISTKLLSVLTLCWTLFNVLRFSEPKFLQTVSTGIFRKFILLDPALNWFDCLHLNSKKKSKNCTIHLVLLLTGVTLIGFSTIQNRFQRHLERPSARLSASSTRKENNWPVLDLCFDCTRLMFRLFKLCFDDSRPMFHLFLYFGLLERKWLCLTVFDQCFDFLDFLDYHGNSR